MVIIFALSNLCALVVLTPSTLLVGLMVCVVRLFYLVYGLLIAVYSSLDLLVGWFCGVNGCGCSGFLACGCMVWHLWFACWC